MFTFSRGFSLFLLASFGVAAAACASPEGAEGKSDQDLTSTKVVKGAPAERLLAVLTRFDAADHAMGGRASADVSNVVCSTSLNASLDERDPLVRVPITNCTLEAGPGFDPAHRDITDAPAKAQVIFDAIQAASQSFIDDGMGKSWATLKTVSCDGRVGLPPDDSSRSITCVLTGEDGAEVTVDGAKAARLVQGFGLVEAVDFAMGGTVGVRATDVRCERRNNAALDEGNAQYKMAAHSCSFTAPGFAAPNFQVDDPEAKANELFSALTAAGLQADFAMGKTAVSTSRATCTKGPGSETSCTFAP
ncbi:MAG TPA: hypothetical protein VM925_10300 [Labilithrix sp.]|nr:hypothetical protein [Labilithrix sp.]